MKEDLGSAGQSSSRYWTSYPASCIYESFSVKASYAANKLEHKQQASLYKSGCASDPQALKNFISTSSTALDRLGKEAIAIGYQ